MRRYRGNERYQQPQGPESMHHDDELLALYNRWLEGVRPSEDDMARLVDAGYLYKKLRRLDWEPTPACKRMTLAHNPESMRQWNEAIQNMCGEQSCSLKEALSLGLLLDAGGYWCMTSTGSLFDGLQLLHALIYPDMPFTTHAAHFHGCAKGQEAEAMHHALDDGKEEWAGMRERILTSLTDEDRLLLGLLPREEERLCPELPPTEELSEREGKIKDLILDTAERVQRAEDTARKGQ